MFFFYKIKFIDFLLEVEGWIVYFIFFYIYILCNKEGYLVNFFVGNIVIRVKSFRKCLFFVLLNVFLGFYLKEIIKDMYK